jgi:hypothetical protein
MFFLIKAIENYTFLFAYSHSTTTMKRSTSTLKHTVIVMGVFMNQNLFTCAIHSIQFEQNESYELPRKIF